MTRETRVREAIDQVLSTRGDLLRRLAEVEAAEKRIGKHKR
jgi:hypothetical protein